MSENPWDKSARLWNSLQDAHKALAKFGRHEADCCQHPDRLMPGHDSECNCGLEDAISDAAQALDE